jgi:hypothetical protein
MNMSNDFIAEVNMPRAERVLREMKEGVSRIRAPNGYIVAAGVAIAASIALRVFAVRQVVRFGPPRLFPVAKAIGVIAPLALFAGLYRKIDRLEEALGER